jgi:CheY-like chemotaxis protein
MGRHHHLQPGARLGRYRIADPIGAGGMGMVYRAVHLDLGRSAAIKVVHPERAARDPGRRAEFLERFEREARATSALTSPHTVEVYDFGRLPDGSFYYAMELLEGLSLRSLVADEGPVRAPRAVHILRQACESLAEAHERGIIHRDIKPQNLFVCRVGLAHDFVKVLDFGLVREVGGVGITGDATLPGTAGYMAPEIIRGHPPAGPRSDLYSLGCVAYWPLTGRPVFERRRTLELLMAHVKEPPVPPSARSERDIPPALDALIMACLAKDPDARPASARTLRGELASCGATPPWTEEDAERWWRLHFGSSGAPISFRPPPLPSVEEAAPAKVLVVDDDRAVRAVLVGLLDQAGYETAAAASGEEALALLHEADVDLVLTDLRMPGMGGMALIAELGVRSPELPVVVLTAHGSIPLAVEAVKAGAREFLTKPFEKDELCGVVDRALGGEGGAARA